MQFMATTVLKKLRKSNILVCPILEYASPLWDPHLIKDSDQIEKVQRTAAHRVTSDYSWLSGVTAILSKLNWPALALCHKISKLQTFVKLFTT